MAGPAQPHSLFVPNKPGDSESLLVQRRTTDRWNQNAGTTGSYFNEANYSGAGAAFSSASTTPVQFTSLPIPFIYYKKFPGSTLRLKLQFSSSTASSGGGLCTFYASITSSGSIQQIGTAYPFTSSTSPIFLADFPASTYRNASTGNVMLAGKISIYIWAKVNSNTYTLTMGTNDWYSLQVAEVAP